MTIIEKEAIINRPKDEVWDIRIRPLPPILRLMKLHPIFRLKIYDKIRTLRSCKVVAGKWT